MKPKEYLRSICFQEIVLRHSTDISYRCEADFLTRLLHRFREQKVSFSTLHDYVESKGTKAAKHIRK